MPEMGGLRVRTKGTVSRLCGPSLMDSLGSFCPDRLRGSGTAATNMCLVATGAVEAFFEIGIHCWDIAAGAVIVKEAGGVLMDVNGAFVGPRARLIPPFKRHKC